MIASLETLVATAPWAFLVGCAVGFVIGARYRIEKRNGGDRHGDDG